MKMKSACALIAVMSFGSAFAANTWYVDPVNGNDAYDGTTSNVVSGTTGPRQTLEKAMALVKTGDTLCLMPGEYKVGSMTRDAAEGARFRMAVTNKNVTVKSYAGAEVTRIVGAGTGETDANALACAGVKSGCTGVVFDGITFADGCGYRNDKAGDNIKIHGGGLSAVDTTWAIDCVFTNCSARFGGGQCYGKSARCKYIGCRCNTSGGGDAIAYTTWNEFCLFARNGSSANASLRAIWATTTYRTKIVNCTVVRNRAGSFGIATGASSAVLNSLVVDNVIWSGSEPDNGSGTANALFVTNSLIGKCKNALGEKDDKSLVNVSAVDAGLVNPWAGEDYRLVSWGKAADIGDAAHVYETTLPSGYLHLDLEGNPVPASGPIAAGCYLYPVPDGTVTGAAFVFNDGGVSSEIEGVDYVFASDTYTKQYYRPLAEPWTYRIRPVGYSGKHYINMSAPEEKQSGSTQNHYPMSDGWTPFAASLPAESNLTITVSFCNDSAVRYVDAEHGSDDYDGTSASRGEGTVGPWKTLAHACTNSTGVTLICAAPGTYDEGFVTMTSTDKQGVTSSQRRRAVLNGSQHLVATEGPEKTFIVGAPDPATQGLGPDAIAGVGAEIAHASVSGFTITGCFTADSTVLHSCGAAAVTRSGPFLVLDSIITNNTARSSSAFRSVTAVRCLIADNRSRQYAVGNSECAGCTLYGNYKEIGGSDASDNAELSSSTLYGCTLDLDDRGRPNDDNSTIYGSILCGGCFTQRVSVVDAWPGCVFGTDPIFANREARDYRLGVLSPAVGLVSYWDMPTKYRIYAGWDAEGRALRGTGSATGGWRTTAGAAQNAPLACTVIGGGQSGETVTGGKLGTNVVERTDGITFTASAERPLECFEVNGGRVTPTGRSYSFVPSVAAGEVTSVRAIYGTDWYVDQASGSDGNDGGAADRAKATISAALAKAVSGDTVHVAPGTYGEGEATALAPGASDLLTRVIVPEGVTVVATEGAAKTAILGKECPVEKREGRWEVMKKYGTGAGAARCVYLAKGATLRGFALTGGRTRANAGTEMDMSGAAVYGANLTATVEDCLVKSNFCWRGSLANVTANRCRVVENLGIRATGNAVGPAGVNVAWYNCWIDGNIDFGTLWSPVTVVNTYVGASNFAWANQKVGDDDVTGTGIISDSAPATAFYATTAVPVLNSVLADYIKDGSGCLICATNTIYDSYAYRVEKYWTPESCANCTPLSLDEIAAMYDAGGRLVSKDCAAVDGADAAIAGAALGTVDLHGNARISNGAPDIGPSEYDWRGDYGTLLGRDVTVTEASPLVKALDGTRRLRIPAGCSVVATVTDAVERKVDVAVSGGTLTIKAGETTIGTYTADARVIFTPNGEPLTFAFEANPETANACASIGRIGRNTGVVLIVR